MSCSFDGVGVGPGSLARCTILERDRLAGPGADAGVPERHTDPSRLAGPTRGSHPLRHPVDVGRPRRVADLVLVAVKHNLPAVYPPGGPLGGRARDLGDHMTDTSTRPEPIRLTDLAEPRFSPEAQAIIDATSGFADAVELDAGVLMGQAVAATGRDALGAMDFVPRLELLLWCYEHEADLSPMGRVGAAAAVGQLLRNRLALTDLLARHPEIHDVGIVAPIVIAGLPRTGTTHLHNLLSADPRLRSMPYWESLEPVPSPAEAALAGTDADPRILRTDGSMAVMDVLMPEFKRMHEMTTWHVHEEIQLLAIDFSTMLFETVAPMPTWRDAYLAQDQTPHYEYMKTVLKAMQWQRGGERWVLKSPQHLEQFGPLIRTFPDATVLVTHRDPVSVMVSMSTMVSYSARGSHSPVDPVAISAYWGDRLETMLGAAERDRDLLPAAQSMDILFGDFMADDLGTVRRIYELADQPLDEGSLAAIRGYIDGHQRERHGKVVYEPDVLGLDLAARRRAMRTYTERFAVPDEPW